jgi:hypothetical protein
LTILSRVDEKITAPFVVTTATSTESGWRREAKASWASRLAALRRETRDLPWFEPPDFDEDLTITGVRRASTWDD